MRTQMGDLAGSERADLSARLAHALAAWLGPQPRIVSLFAALRDEPDLASLHTLLPACTFLYPLVHGDALTFHQVADAAELRRGAFGILEPDPAIHAACEIEGIEVLLCPGLAFSMSGARLGRGRGFYDRTLARASRDAQRVGVGFTIQFHDQVPVVPHDIPMTHLATEEGVSRAVRS